MTDLTSATVTRLTDGADVGGPGGELRFASDGESVLWSKAVPADGAPPANATSSIRRVALGTGLVTDVASGLVGEVQGIARSGDRVLVARDLSLDAGGRTVRSLLWVSLAGGGAPASEAELAHGVLQYAVLLEGDTRALVVIDVATDPSAPKIAYLTLPVGGGPGEILGVLGNQIVAADVVRR
jgi:hypothetical protein